MPKGVYKRVKGKGHHRRTYRSWYAMMHRCRVKEKYYENISVCDRWLTYSNFLEDMGERPAGKTIDRYPDPYGNYEPDNCRWATPTEQQRNRRNVVFNVYKAELIREMKRQGLRGSEISRIINVKQYDVYRILDNTRWIYQY